MFKNIPQKVQVTKGNNSTFVNIQPNLNLNSESVHCANYKNFVLKRLFNKMVCII